MTWTVIVNNWSKAVFVMIKIEIRCLTTWTDEVNSANNPTMNIVLAADWNNTYVKLQRWTLYSIIIHNTSKHIRRQYNVHTWNRLAIIVWTVASTAPTLTFPLSSVAAWAQCGARLLQWPHHGAKNSTSHMSLLFNTSSSKLLSVSSTTSLESPL